MDAFLGVDGGQLGRGRDGHRSAELHILQDLELDVSRSRWKVQNEYIYVTPVSTFET